MVTSSSSSSQYSGGTASQNSFLFREVFKKTHILAKIVRASLGELPSFFKGQNQSSRSRPLRLRQAGLSEIPRRIGPPLPLSLKNLSAIRQVCRDLNDDSNQPDVLAEIKPFCGPIIDKKFLIQQIVNPLIEEAHHPSDSIQKLRKVEYFVSHGGNPNQETEMGIPLFVSLTRKILLMSAFLAKKTNLNWKTKEGNSLLYFVSDWEDERFVQILLDANAEVHSQSVDGEFPIHKATRSGRIAIVKLITEKDPTSIHAKDRNGNTPLHIACTNGWSDLVEFLLKLGAQVDERNNSGNTPLHLVCKRGYEEDIRIITTLYRSGASLKSLNDSGNTPLHLACFPVFSNGSLMIVRSLVAKGSSIHQQNLKGETPKDLACKGENQEIIEFLGEASSRKRSFQEVQWENAQF